ncbi:flavin reductase family protein [Halorientalis salina]|uniref:flavin reductase family protein n=1 Tax=Halorientalis salina TaxID=2932266 RepID=UPI0010AD2443|nr:flavin reductase family protein [Halorientalis salina]
MKIDPDTFERSLYRTMTGAVVPRPIGWISTTSEDGVDNLAPYSYFNVVSVDPSVVMFAPVDEGPDALKDSARNVLDTGEFVHNVVTRDLAEAMNATSATLPAEESEFDHADIERAESETVAPPRVAAADIAFECELYDAIDIGISTLILGEITMVHVDDSVTTSEGKVDVEKVDAVGRLAGNWYATTRDRFRQERPD